MPEGTPLYHELTVKEFISYMADLKLIPRNKKKAAVEKAILETGLDKVRNRLTENLSRGFKQRVSLAGALVGDPEILILDEPTVGLDPKQVKEIRELIKSLKGKHTVLLSSHILSEVSQICEKVIIIDKGEIIAVDTTENLEKTSNVKSVITIDVEDLENKFEDVIKTIEEITEVKCVETNEDNTKKYTLTIKEEFKDVDLRKKIASLCATNNMLIIEMKKEEHSLEDAFINLISDRPEYSHKEIKQVQYEKELNDLKEEIKEKKEYKEMKKRAKENKNKGGNE